MYLIPPYFIDKSIIGQFRTIHKDDYIWWKIKKIGRLQKEKSKNLSKLLNRKIKYANECKLKIQKSKKIFCI